MAFQRISLEDMSVERIKRDLLPVLSLDGACILEGIESGPIDSLYRELRAFLVPIPVHRPTPSFNTQSIFFPDDFSRPDYSFPDLALQNAFGRVFSKYAFFAEIFGTRTSFLAGVRYIQTDPAQLLYHVDPHIDEAYTLAFCPQGEALLVLVRENVIWEVLGLDEALLLAPGIPHAIGNSGVKDRYSLIMDFLME